MAEKELSQREREFIYKYQFQRGLNPMYIPFTKKGFILTVFMFYMIYTGNTGLSLTFLSALLYWWIYRSDFDYRFNERERVWLFALWNNFITRRVEKPFESKPIIFGKEE